MLTKNSDLPPEIMHAYSLFQTSNGTTEQKLAS